MAYSERDSVVRGERSTGDPRRQAALATVVALVLLLICWWAAAQWYRDRLLADERARAQAQVHAIESALTTAVARRVDVADGLAAFVRSDPSEQAIRARFDGFAGALDPAGNGILSLQVFDDSTARFEFPPTTNASPARADLTQDPSPPVREAALRALASGQTSVSRPYALPTGETVLMATRPISIAGELWGYAVVLVDLPTLLRDGGLGAGPDATPYGLSVALRDDGGQVFYGPSSMFDAQPVTLPLELSGTRWELAAIPVGGWDEAVRRRPGLIFESAALVVVGLMAGLTYLIANRQATLAISVRERTAEIAQINTTLERQAALLDLAHDAILVRDLDGVISFWNLGAERLYGWSPGEALGAVSHDLLHTVFPSSREDADNALLRDGRWDGELLHTRRDGTQIPVSSRQALRRDEQGRPLDVLEINIDITEQKLEEEELERRVVERTRELRALLELSDTVGSTLELRPLLGLILDQLLTAIPYTHAGVMSNEGDGRHVVLEYRGPMPYAEVVGRTVPPGIAAVVEETIARRRPQIVEDWEATDGGGHYTRVLADEGVEMPAAAVRSARGGVVVPLIVRGMVVGALAMSHGEVGHYREDDARLAMAFGQRVAIAIENARLYEAARERAALEERQRLARDLHDSVSQVLYAIALIGSSAEELREIAPERLADLHAQVLALAEAGLAELRALIFELRPESLEREGLVAALDKQAVAVQARHGVTVRAELGEEPDLPLPAKEALYRIAQEALQNAVKHARAKSVVLVLETHDGEVSLCISDDGIGFDPAAEYPGHLGLHSMRERAAGIGATLEIDGEAGRGVRIVARLRGDL